MVLPTVCDRTLSFHTLPSSRTTLTGSVYRRTRLMRYLDTARRMTSYFLNNIPVDGIIPWDFNAPLVPARPADTSAAMIAVNGLLLLAEQEQNLISINQTREPCYLNAAIQVLIPLRLQPLLHMFSMPFVDFAWHCKCILGA